MFGKQVWEVAVLRICILQVGWQTPHHVNRYYVLEPFCECNTSIIFTKRVLGRSGWYSECFFCLLFLCLGFFCFPGLVFQWEVGLDDTSVSLPDWILQLSWATPKTLHSLLLLARQPTVVYLCQWSCCVLRTQKLGTSFLTSCSAVTMGCFWIHQFW